jgi:hypothetical protein
MQVVCLAARLLICLACLGHPLLRLDGLLCCQDVGVVGCYNRGSKGADSDRLCTISPRVVLRGCKCLTAATLISAWVLQ